MKRYFLFAILAVFFTAAVCVPAADALRITLKRVVFEGNKRAEVITIINNTDSRKPIVWGGVIL